MRSYAQGNEAVKSLKLAESLQIYFIKKLNTLCDKFGDSKYFEPIEWLRDSGVHGGGIRYESRDQFVFNSASVNLSQVHYDDDNSKKLSSATAISTIVHPANPHAPSMHMHISWTQTKDGIGYWRIMGDLNPSIPIQTDKHRFEKKLEQLSSSLFKKAKQQGDKYFYIPTLSRTRGISHFYLENFNRGDFDNDMDFAKRIGEGIIDVYIDIVYDALKKHKCYTKKEEKQQVYYHTIYVFQVLTLDRGTTSGLLAHNQNDIGIMGSIPLHINKPLLYSWLDLIPKPQDKLLMTILDALPKGNIVQITPAVKKRLANALRSYYKKFPEALNMQASGDILPNSVENHTSYSK